MTKTERQLQDIIDATTAENLAESWNRSEREVGDAISRLLSRRMAAVAFADFDEEL